MKKLALFLPFMALCLLAVSTTAVEAGEKDSKYFQKLLAEKSQHVVSVKAVIQMGMGGRTQESKIEIPGILVDPSGIIIVPGEPFTSQTRTFRGKTYTIKRVPVSLKVIFPPSDKEYDAFLGASDSRFGLAFLKLKETKDLKISAINLEDSSEAVIGKKLLAVTRLGKTFDYAPVFGRNQIAGKVQKPRTMWALNQVAGPGVALFDKDGKIVGIMGQIDVGEGTDANSLNGGVVSFQNILMSQGIFLLSAKTVNLLLKQARRKIKQLEAKMKEQAKKKDGDKKDGKKDGDKDDKKDGDKKEKDDKEDKKKDDEKDDKKENDDDKDDE